MSEEIDDLKTKISFLFTYYTNFGEKTNGKLLKSTKFHKMMHDSGVKDDSGFITSTNLDLLFFSETKHNSHINYETFLNFIPKLAKEKYPNEPDVHAFKRLMDMNLLPLAMKLMKDSEMGEEKQQLMQEIDEVTIRVLEYVAPVLFKIYMAYFPWEPQNYMKKEECSQKTQNSLFSFVKDYEISPPLLTKSLVFQIYSEVINLDISKLTRSPQSSSLIPFLKHDVGTNFTLARFYAFLIRCSYMLYSTYFQDSNKEFSNAERFVYFLEMLELSHGFRNLEKKTASTHNSKNSLLIPKKTLFKILHNQEYSVSEGHHSKEEARLFIHYGNVDSPFKGQYSAREKDQQPSDIKDENEESKIENKSEIKTIVRNPSFLVKESQYNGITAATNQFLEKNNEDLLKIFQFYCSLGEPMNTNKMKSIKFKKLLIDANIMNKKETTEQKEPEDDENESKSKANLASLGRYLSSIDADLIFSKLKAINKTSQESKIKYNKNIHTPELGVKEFYNNSQTNHGKLDFIAFVKSLEMICQKLFPDYQLEAALNYLWSHHLSILLKTLEKNKIDERSIGTNKIEVLSELLQNKDIVEILATIYKPIMVYYNFYSNKNGLINFNGFIKFCKDFQIFPDLITKAKLLRIYYSLSLLFSSPMYDKKASKPNTNYSVLLFFPAVSLSFVNMQDENVKAKIEGKIREEDLNEVIDSTLFVQCLALCSLEIYFSEPQPNVLEKICFFFELINYSDGRKKVQKELGHTKSPSGASWDVLSNVRKKYPNIFYRNKGDKIKNERNFDDFLRDNMEINKT